MNLYIIRANTLAKIFKRAIAIPHDPMIINQMGTFRSTGHSFLNKIPFSIPNITENYDYAIDLRKIPMILPIVSIAIGIKEAKPTITVANT